MPAINARLIGGENIEKALLNAFEKWTKEDINEKFWETQFRRKDWPYESTNEGLTIRENPSAFIPEAGSLRDIYDYGDLMQSGIKSYKYESSSDSGTAHWHWDATNSTGNEYAAYVHNGTRLMSGRPFTDRISDAKFSFRLPIGKALLDRMRLALDGLHAN